MTRCNPPRLIVLASSLNRAREIGARFGVPVSGVIWPRSLADLRGLDAVDVYADMSLWRHANAAQLADYFATRLRVADGLPAVAHTH